MKYKMLLLSGNSCLTFFFDPGTLSTTAAKEVQLRTANTSTLVQLYGIDIWGEQWKCSFYTYTIRYLSDRKAGSASRALAFDNVSPEALNTLFTAFNDLIVNSYIVTSFEFWKFLLAC